MITQDGTVLDLQGKTVTGPAGAPAVWVRAKNVTICNGIIQGAAGTAEQESGIGIQNDGTNLTLGENLKVYGGSGAPADTVLPAGNGEAAVKNSGSMVLSGAALTGGSGGAETPQQPQKGNGASAAHLQVGSKLELRSGTLTGGSGHTGGAAIQMEAGSSLMGKTARATGGAGSMAGGHAIAVSNDTFQPNGRPWFSRRKAFQTAEESYQSIQQLMSAEALAGAAISAHLPPFDAAMLPDGRTVYDVCNALGMNCLSPAVSYASNFYRENDGKAEAERIVRSVQARLHDDSGWFDGKVIRMDGGLAPTLTEPAVPLAISRVLRLLQAAGYELLTVDELVARSPFADLDATAESFEAACDLLKRGYTVGCLGGTFRPDAEMQRDALYAMMVPPHIMQDYMISRLMKTEPAYGVNRRYEKEFLMAPGSPASAGMFSSDRTIKQYAEELWHLPRVEL